MIPKYHFHYKVVFQGDMQLLQYKNSDITSSILYVILQRSMQFLVANETVNHSNDYQYHVQRDRYSQGARIYL